MSAPRKVLLVDDEPHIRTFIGLILKQVGLETVIEMDNGTDAVALFERERPDLVVLDVNMPGIDGLETLRRILVIEPACVVVILTSVAIRQTVETALDCGATQYIRKDNPPAQIRQMLAEVIRENF